MLLDNRLLSEGPNKMLSYMMRMLVVDSDMLMIHKTGQYNLENLRFKVLIFLNKSFKSKKKNYTVASTCSIVEYAIVLTLQCLKTHRWSRNHYRSWRGATASAAQRRAIRSDLRSRTVACTI